MIFFCSRGNIIMSFAKKIDKTIRPSVRLLTGKRRETLLTFDDHSTNNTQQKIWERAGGGDGWMDGDKQQNNNKEQKNNRPTPSHRSIERLAHASVDRLGKAHSVVYIIH